jgi:hypothetical protein
MCELLRGSHAESESQEMSSLLEVSSEYQFSSLTGSGTKGPKSLGDEIFEISKLYRTQDELRGKCCWSVQHSNSAFPVFTRVGGEFFDTSFWKVIRAWSMMAIFKAI